MRTLRKLAIAVLVVFTAMSCTQYQIIPYPFPDGGGYNDSIDVSTAADLVSAVLKAQNGDVIRSNDVTVPSSLLGVMDISKNITITGNITVTNEMSAYSLGNVAASEMKTTGTGNPLFTVTDGAIVDFSGLHVNVLDTVTNLISAVVDVQSGGIKANGFNVTASSSATVTGVYIGASVSAKNVNITASAIIVSIDAANEDAPTIAETIKNEVTTATLPYDASTPEEFDSLLKEYGKVRLMQDITITSFSYTEAGEYDIYLNEKTLTFNIPGTTNTEATTQINTGTTVAFYNGTMDLRFSGTPSSRGHLALTDGSTLILDKVIMTAERDAINTTAANCTLEVRNGSSITSTGGSFAIATNASNPPYNVTINLSDSTFDAPFTAICVNIDANLTMTRCKASSNHVAVLVRGGTAKFEDCEFSSRGLVDIEGEDGRTDLGYRFETVWGSGTFVSYATLVVGNTLSTAYKYDTSVELINTTLDMTINPGKNDKAKTLFVGSVGEYSATLKTDNESQADYVRNGAYMGPNCIVECNGTTYELAEKTIGEAVAPYN